MKAKAKAKANCGFLLSLLFVSALLITKSYAFQSDELLTDDEEFGLEGGRSPDPILTTKQASTAKPTRKRSSDSASESDSRIQFPLEHAFGDSEFSPAGTFSARLKTSPHGGQTLTKLRFSRDTFSETEKNHFKSLLEGDDFYRIRLPSHVLKAAGAEYVISSVKARCLLRDALDEHFVIHMEGVNILAVNYGSPGSCPYPRQLKLPAKWTFKSHTVLKSSDLAPRALVIAEEIVDVNVEGEEVKPPEERSFWAKYWMYLIPLGLIVMNAMTQAMNMPEEPAAASGQPAPQGQQAIAGRGQPTVTRRR